MDYHGGSGSRGGSGSDAARFLEISLRLLVARDLGGCKSFADRALEADPLLDGVDQILAVVDVLLASQRPPVNGHPDWYAVLQLDPPAANVSAVLRHYRRLALALDPARNRLPGADPALRLVADAFSVLSDPSRKSNFDAELRLAASKPSPPLSSSAVNADAPAPFWTACPSCCHVHQFAWEYRNRFLRCPNCHHPFQAAEMAAPPPAVPGTDMYYCVWGFFPLGSSNGPTLSSDWKPRYPEQMLKAQQPQSSMQPRNGSRKPVMPSRGNRKTTARKKVGGGGSKKGAFDGGSEPDGAGPEAWGGTGARPSSSNVAEEGFRGININEEATAPEGGAGLAVGDEEINFHIDMEATEALLGNLHHLPFLRGDEHIAVRMPSLGFGHWRHTTK